MAKGKSDLWMETLIRVNIRTEGSMDSGRTGGRMVQPFTKARSEMGSGTGRANGPRTKPNTSEAM